MTGTTGHGVLTGASGTTSADTHHMSTTQHAGTLQSEGLASEQHDLTKLYCTCANDTLANWHNTLWWPGTS